MMPWYRLVGQLFGLLLIDEVVSGHWWYEDDSPHITLEVFPQPDKGRKSLRSGSKISPDSGRRSVSGSELQARLVKMVNIQCGVAKLAWRRPSVATLERVGTLISTAIAIDWVTSRSSLEDGSMYSQAHAKDRCNQ